MPNDYIDIDWDRPRKLMYDWEQLENLGLALGGIGFAEIQMKMAQVNLQVIHKVVFYGLRHYDPRFKEADVPALLAAARRKRIFLPAVIEQIADAINLSEVLGENKQAVAEGATSADPS